MLCDLTEMTLYFKNERELTFATYEFFKKNNYAFAQVTCHSC